MTRREKHELVVLFIYIRGKNTLPGSSNSRVREGSQGKGLGERAHSARPGQRVVKVVPQVTPSTCHHPCWQSELGDAGQRYQAAQLGAPVVSAPPACPSRTLPPLFSPLLEASADFVPLGGAGAGAASGSACSQRWGLGCPVCQPAAFTARQRARLSGAGKHQRDRESSGWTRGP